MEVIPLTFINKRPGAFGENFEEINFGTPLIAAVSAGVRSRHDAS
jgi:hypothetical protein